MMNIVNRKVYQSSIPIPCNKAHRLELIAANNSTGHLEGIIQNVELTCGEVKTWANIYIADNAPFDLLLGRPWQRGNFVSIDERANGTYLLFKDKHMRVRF